jgi:hypothetical protein
MIASRLKLTIMWLHAIKNKLIDENLTRIEIHGILIESILSSVVFSPG